MSKRNVLNGIWVRIDSEEEFTDIRRQATVGKGMYSGPGWYRQLQYAQKCPRGCCYDDVIELLTPDEIIKEVEIDISKLADLLRESRSKLPPVRKR